MSSCTTSGDGVGNTVGSMRLFLLAGSLRLSSSLRGVERFREIGEIGAMIAVRGVCVEVQDIIDGGSSLELLNSERKSSSMKSQESRDFEDILVAPLDSCLLSLCYCPRFT